MVEVIEKRRCRRYVTEMTVVVQNAYLSPVYPRTGI